MSNLNKLNQNVFQEQGMCILDYYKASKLLSFQPLLLQCISHIYSKILPKARNLARDLDLKVTGTLGILQKRIKTLFLGGIIQFCGR